MRSGLSGAAHSHLQTHRTATPAYSRIARLSHFHHMFPPPPRCSSRATPDQTGGPPSQTENRSTVATRSACFAAIDVC